MSFLVRSDSDSKKLKSLLKTSLERIKIAKSKRCTLARQSRNDAAQLLMKGQYEKAESRVEYVLREENMVAAYEQLEEYCQVLLDRAASLKDNRECPSDLKGVMGALFYASPRCGDLPELHDCRNLLKSKYGEGFFVVATENAPEPGINKIMERLTSRTPSRELKINLLKQIALENNIKWTFDMVSSRSAKKSNSSVRVPSSSDKADSTEHANQNPVDEKKTEKDSMATTKAVPSSSQEDTQRTKTPLKYNLPSNNVSNGETNDHCRMSNEAKMANAQISRHDQFTRARQKVVKVEHEGNSIHNQSADVKKERPSPSDHNVSRTSRSEYVESKTRSKTRSDLLDIQTAAEVARRSAAEAAEAADLAFSLARSNPKKKINLPSISRPENETSHKSMDQRSGDGAVEFVPNSNKASRRLDQNIQKKSLSHPEISDEDLSATRYARTVVDRKKVAYQEAQLPPVLPKYDDYDDSEEEIPTYTKRNIGIVYENHQQNVPLSSKGKLDAAMPESSHQQTRKPSLDSDFRGHNNFEADGVWSVPNLGYVEGRLMRPTRRGPHEYNRHEELHELTAKLGINEHYVKQTEKTPSSHLPRYDGGTRLSEEGQQKKNNNRRTTQAYEPLKRVMDNGYVANNNGQESAVGRIKQEADPSSYEDVFGSYR